MQQLNGNINVAHCGKFTCNSQLVNIQKMETQYRSYFTLLDYFLFAFVLVVSLCIGLYYAIIARKSTITLDDYLLGDRKMGLLPVSCSLIATTVTGSTIVGQAAETYTYGTHNWMYGLIKIVLPILVPWIFLPIFSELNFTSTFEYFEKRFNRKVRLLASGLFLLSGLIFLPVTVYIPAITFQGITGFSTYWTVTILSVLCAFYTAFGGFKAVLWTDVVQLVLMIVSLLTICIIGLQSIGGIGNVLEAGNRGGRIILVNIDRVNSRSSLYGYLFSVSLLTIYQYGLNQINVQRFLSLPNIKKMTISSWIVAIVCFIFMCLSPLLGLIIYANYETCDPFSAGFIKKPDQILPYFIQERASLFPGFNGIFIAGIFSASLSTTSSYLNSMSGIIYKDFISSWFPRISGKTSGSIMKFTVILLGFIQIGIVLFIEKLGSFVKMSSQCYSLNSAVFITLFVLGIMVPKANSTGAQVGALAAIITVLTLMIGSIDVKPEPKLHFRLDGCESQGNYTQIYSLSFASNTDTRNYESQEIYWPFKISFIYYGLIGTSIGLSTGYIASLLSGGNTISDKRLIATFLRTADVKDEEIQLRS